MKRQLKILVIADNSEERMSICSLLQQSDTVTEIIAVSDISQGINKINQQDVNLILFDYSFPVRDSPNIHQELKFLGIKIPIIILTTPDEEEITLELLTEVAIDYVFKHQLSLESLPYIFNSTIRIHQAERKADLVYQKFQEANQNLIYKEQEIKIYKQQINLQQSELMEASKLKAEFLSTISHEFKTPMNVIIGLSQILLNPKLGQLTPQQIDMVERILNNSRNLLKLWNKTLDFSQLESGKQVCNPEIFDLSNLVNTTVSEISCLAKEKRISLFVATNLDNKFIFNDAIKIRQILLNLLSNAIKFTEEGSIWLDVKEAPNHRFTITIRDTGIGISSQDYQNIFEAFRQVDQSINRKYSGSGIGLAIVNSLVQLMKGQIFIDSKIGVGTVFKIELPRQINLSAQPSQTYNTQFANHPFKNYTYDDSYITSSPSKKYELQSIFND